MSLISSKNIGCWQSFKWRQLLKRHKAKCSYPAIKNKEKYICKEDGSFQCANCKKTFSKRSNTSCHIKTCKGDKIKNCHSFDVCQKSFAYKSILERHLKTHKDHSAQKKSQSVLNPTDTHADDDFVPSLVFPNRNLIETVNTNESNIDDIFYEEHNVVGQTEIRPQIDSQSEPNQTIYFKQYCEQQRKVNNLETIISNLTSAQKRVVVDQFSKRHSSADTDCNKEYKSYACDSLISHLKSVW